MQPPPHCTSIPGAVIDACRPFHWKDSYPRVNTPSSEALHKVREKFGHLIR